MMEFYSTCVVHTAFITTRSILLAGIGLAVLRALAGAGANVGMHGLGDAKAIARLRDEIAAETGVQVSSKIVCTLRFRLA